MSDWKNVQYKDGKMRTSEGGGGGGSSTFSGLDDVNFSNLQNGQVPKYNSTTQKWENANESGGGASALEDLTDVDLSNLSDHQPLRYNAISQKWVNGADSYPPIIYSDTEREVGVWRDGKPLYERVLDFSNSPISLATSWADTNVIIQNINIIAHSLICTNNLILNSSEVTSNEGTNWHINIRITVSATRSAKALILQYTKTTDTAGSGSWTTSGSPTHHYSTTEQVIGTWVDGKPLYEKTIVKTNYQLVSGNNDISLDVQNMENLVDSQIHVMNSTHTSIRRLPHYEKTGSDQLSYIITLSNATLTIYAYNTWSTPNIFITIKYTKTTDT